MPYALLASVIAAGLTIRFLLDGDNSPRAKALVVALLFAGLFGTLLLADRSPALAIAALLLQAGLAIFLLIHARYRGG